MPFSAVQSKTIFRGFSVAEQSAILAAMQSAYAGSATARAMFDNWVSDPLHTIDITEVAGAFRAYTSSGAGTGRMELDLNFLTDNTYLTPNGKAVEDTLLTALVHELGHGLTGRTDTTSTSDYKGPNVQFVNVIYKELGLPEQISYGGYDENGSILKLNRDYTNGTSINVGLATNSNLSTFGTNDLLIGGPGANKLLSNGGNDYLVGGGGNDILNGGDGRDVAVFFGKPSDYDIKLNSDGTWTSRHIRGAADEGSDTLSNVEAARFDGGAQFELKKKGLSFQTDFAFVIDTTGSMGSSIGSVKTNANAIINALFADDKIDARIAIVGFKDTTNGEPSSVILPFTDQDSFAARKAAALAAINGITVDGGGDLPETAYDGLRTALNGSIGQFRPSAGTLRIALFTDAEAKDTALASTVAALAANIGATIASGRSVAEGTNGVVDTFELTFSSSRAAGNDASDGPALPFDPTETPVTIPATTANLEIYTIFTGPTGVDTSGLSAIASATGGSFLTAPDNDALVSALLAIINIPPDQVLVGSDGNDLLVGGEGNDLIQGLGGDDSLVGNGGIDFLDGGSGADSIDGGAGFDLATWLGESSGATLNLLDQTLNSGSALGDIVANVEGFYLSNFVDDFYGGSSVFVYGFAGNDRIAGSNDSDIIDGGAGADIIDGGDGFDYISYYSSAESINLDLKHAENNTGFAEGDAISNAEAYILTTQNDTFLGSDTGENIVFGYEGADVFVGGLNANNWFFGGDGDDRMIGGGVKDLYVGGAGADTIVLSSSSPIGGSSVFGFSSGEDRIELSRSDFGLSSTYAFNEGSTLVSGTSPVATSNDPTFFYYSDSGLFYYDADGNGANAAALLMQFDNPPSLTFGDFILV